MKIIIMFLFAFTLIYNVNANDNKTQKESKSKVYIIDNRTKAEYDAGHIDGAILIPHDVVRDKIESVVKDKNAKIILYCRSGRRSGIAQSVLKDMGYANVENYGGMESAKIKLQQK